MISKSTLVLLIALISFKSTAQSETTTTSSSEEQTNGDTTKFPPITTDVSEITTNNDKDKFSNATESSETTTTEEVEITTSTPPTDSPTNNYQQYSNRSSLDSETKNAAANVDEEGIEGIREENLTKDVQINQATDPTLEKYVESVSSPTTNESTTTDISEVEVDSDGSTLKTSSSIYETTQIESEAIPQVEENAAPEIPSESPTRDNLDILITEYLTSSTSDPENNDETVTEEDSVTTETVAPESTELQSESSTRDNSEILITEELSGDSSIDTKNNEETIAEDDTVTTEYIKPLKPPEGNRETVSSNEEAKDGPRITVPPNLIPTQSSESQTESEAIPQVEENATPESTETTSESSTSEIFSTEELSTSSSDPKNNDETIAEDDTVTTENIKPLKPPEGNRETVPSNEEAKDGPGITVPPNLTPTQSFESQTESEAISQFEENATPESTEISSESSTSEIFTTEEQSTLSSDPKNNDETIAEDDTVTTENIKPLKPAEVSQGAVGPANEEPEDGPGITVPPNLTPTQSSESQTESEAIPQVEEQATPESTEIPSESSTRDNLDIVITEYLTSSTSDPENNDETVTKDDSVTTENLNHSKSSEGIIQDAVDSDVEVKHGPGITVPPKLTPTESSLYRTESEEIPEIEKNAATESSTRDNSESLTTEELSNSSLDAKNNDETIDGDDTVTTENAAPEQITEITYESSTSGILTTQEHREELSTSDTKNNDETIVEGDTTENIKPLKPPEGERGSDRANEEAEDGPGITVPPNLSTTQSSESQTESEAIIPQAEENAKPESKEIPSESSTRENLDIVITEYLTSSTSNPENNDEIVDTDDPVTTENVNNLKSPEGIIQGAVPSEEAADGPGITVPPNLTPTQSFEYQTETKSETLPQVEENEAPGSSEITSESSTNDNSEILTTEEVNNSTSDPENNDETVTTENIKTFKPSEENQGEVILNEEAEDGPGITVPPNLTPTQSTESQTESEAMPQIQENGEPESSTRDNSGILTTEELSSSSSDPDNNDETVTEDDIATTENIKSPEKNQGAVPSNEEADDGPGISVPPNLTPTQSFESQTESEGIPEVGEKENAAPESTEIRSESSTRDSSEILTTDPKINDETVTEDDTPTTENMNPSKPPEGNQGAVRSNEEAEDEPGIKVPPNLTPTQSYESQTESGAIPQVEENAAQESTEKTSEASTIDNSEILTTEKPREELSTSSSDPKYNGETIAEDDTSRTENIKPLKPTEGNKVPSDEEAEDGTGITVPSNLTPTQSSESQTKSDAIPQVEEHATPESTEIPSESSTRDNSEILTIKELTSSSSDPGNNYDSEDDSITTENIKPLKPPDGNKVPSDEKAEDGPGRITVSSNLTPTQSSEVQTESEVMPQVEENAAPEATESESESSTRDTSDILTTEELSSSSLDLKNNEETVAEDDGTTTTENIKPLRPPEGNKGVVVPSNEEVKYGPAITVPSNLTPTQSFESQTESEAIPNDQENVTTETTKITSESSARDNSEILTTEELSSSSLDPQNNEATVTDDDSVTTENIKTLKPPEGSQRAVDPSNEEPEHEPGITVPPNLTITQSSESQTESQAIPQVEENAAPEIPSESPTRDNLDILITEYLTSSTSDPENNDETVTEEDSVTTETVAPESTELQSESSTRDNSEILITEELSGDSSIDTKNNEETIAEDDTVTTEYIKPLKPPEGNRETVSSNEEAKDGPRITVPPNLIPTQSSESQTESQAIPQVEENATPESTETTSESSTSEILTAEELSTSSSDPKNNDETIAEDDTVTTENIKPLKPPERNRDTVSSNEEAIDVPGITVPPNPIPTQSTESQTEVEVEENAAPEEPEIPSESSTRDNSEILTTEELNSSSLDPQNNEATVTEDDLVTTENIKPSKPPEGNQGAVDSSNEEPEDGPGITVPPNLTPTQSSESQTESEAIPKVQEYEAPEETEISSESSTSENSEILTKEELTSTSLDSQNNEATDTEDDSVTTKNTNSLNPPEGNQEAILSDEEAEDPAKNDIKIFNPQEEICMKNYGECEAEGFFRLNNSCTKFYECYYNKNCNRLIPSKIHTCPSCLKFHARKMRCDFPEKIPECTNLLEHPRIHTKFKNKPGFCTGAGSYPIPEDCSKYYKCKEGYFGRIRLNIEECEEGEEFNQELGKCSKDKTSSTCSNSLKTPSCGKFRRNGKRNYIGDAYDCTKYYVCINGRISGEQCGSDEFFNGKTCEEYDNSNFTDWNLWTIILQKHRE